MYAIGGSTIPVGVGLLINNRNGNQVDLFLIGNEEASIKNKITGENIKDLSQLDDHVEMLPAEVTVSGMLVNQRYGNKYGGQGVYQDKVPTGKLNKIIAMCNDASPGTSFTFRSPALPYNYVDYYPTSFTYRNEGQKNAVIFDLTLEEIGQQKKLRRGAKLQTNSTGENRKSKHHSRFHASIASPTEDGGGQVERGAPSVISLDNIVQVESLTEKMEQKGHQVAPNSSSVKEIISKLLGAEDDLAKRSTIQAFKGVPGQAPTDLFKDKDTEGDLGQALNQLLEGAYFPATAPLTDKQLAEDNIIENIPVFGGILNEVKGLPREREFLLEVTKGHQSSILISQHSPVMRKVRDYVISAGANETTNVDVRKIRDSTLLSSRENRTLEDLFVRGMETLRTRARQHESLRGFVTELPKIGEERGLTYYNYYGQPVISFEGVIDLDFGRWSTQDVTLNDEEYELETYWNRGGFPVVSLHQSDGAQVIKQTRAFLGSDLLESAQSAPNLNGVHIIPFSVTNNKTIIKDKVGESIYFGVVHSNRQALERVL